MNKNRILTLGIIVIFIMQVFSGISIISFAAPGTVYVNATYDSLTTGNIISTTDTAWANKTADGVTFTNSFVGGSVAVVEDPSTTDKSVKMTIPSTTTGGYLRGLRNNIGANTDTNILLQTRVKINVNFDSATGNNFTFGPTVSGANWWSGGTVVNFYNNGTANKITWGGSDVGTWTKNNWYDIKFLYRLDTNMCTLYVKGDGETAITTSYSFASTNLQGAGKLLTSYFPTDVRTIYNVTDGKSAGDVMQSYFRAAQYSGVSLISSTPMNNAVDVPINNKEIKLTFDMPMEDLTNKALSLANKTTSGATPVIYTFKEKDLQTNTYTFQTNGTLSYDTNYELALSSIRDISGLNSTQTITFTTVSNKPVARNLAIDGSVASGNTITAKYDYLQIDNEGEKDSEIKWYISPNKTIDYAATPVGIGNSYAVKTEDIGKYISFSVTPKSNTGGIGETKQLTTPALVSEGPVVKNVTIKGTCEAGSTISADYEYLSGQKNPEAGSTFRWLKSNSENGTFYEIPNATQLTYTLRDADAGAYIKIEVTPKCKVKIEGMDVVILGQANKSAPVLIKASTIKPDTTTKKAVVTEKIRINNPNNNKPLASISFTDIDKHWAKYSILSVVNAGIMEGISDTIFAPDQDITRAEFIYGISQVLKIYPTKYIGAFNDVYSSTRYANFIQSAYNMGLIQGNNGNLYPNNSITREEMCAILIRALKKTGVNLPQKDNISFTDGDQISGWAKKDVDLAVAYGLLAGNGNNSFEPQLNTNRAQGATIFGRLNNYVGSPSFTSSVNIPVADAAANPSSKYESQNKNSVITLTNLGIIEANEDEDGKIDTTVKIRRDDFIKLIIKSIGVKDVPIAGMLPFTDIDKKNSNRNFIGAALGAGYISADDKFYPERGVTMMQAAVMLTKLLGYEEYAKNSGGYPKGYYNVAQKKSLFKDVDFSADRVLSIGEAAQMLLNCYNQTILQASAFGSSVDYFANSGDTFSKVYLNIEKKTGQITANEFTSINNNAACANKKSVCIDGENINVGITNAATLVGHRVDYYVQTDDNLDTKTLLSITPSAYDNVVKVPAKLVESYYNMSFVYYDDENKSRQKTLKLNRDTPVIYNGLYFGIANDLRVEQLKPDIGSVEFIDNNNDQNYELIVIKSYKTVVVGNADKDNLVIVDQIDSTRINFKENGADPHIIIRKYGMNVTFSTLKQWNVLLICDSGAKDGKRMVEIECGLSEITDPVESVDGTEKKVVFKGVTYDISPQFKNSFKSNTISIRDSGTFYLDGFGNVAAFRSAVAVSNDYAILVKAGKAKSLNSIIEFKIFNSKGEIHIVTAEKTFYVNNESYKADSDADYAKLIAELNKSTLSVGKQVQLVKLELNADGNLSKMTTAVLDTAATDGALLVRKRVSNSSIFDNIQVKKQNNTLIFGGNYLSSKNTTMFSVPIDETLDNMYTILQPANIVHDRYYNITAYNFDKFSGLPDVIVFQEPPRDIGNTDPVFVVEKVVSALDANGEGIYRITGVNNGDKSSWDVSNQYPEVEAIAKELKFGDIIRISLNSKNQISNIKVALYMKDYRTTPFGISSSGWGYGIYGVIAGASVEANGVGISTDLNASKDTYYYPLTWAKIIVIDTTKETVYNGSITDLIENMTKIRPDARAYVVSDNTNVRNVVVFK